MLKFLDFRGEHGSSGADEEDDGADGDHAVDEIIGEDFKNCAHRVGNDDSEHRLDPAVTHEGGCRFPTFVHFFQ